MDEGIMRDWVDKLGISPETIYVAGVIAEFITKWYSEIQEWEEEKMEMYMERFDDLDEKIEDMTVHLSTITESIKELKEAGSSMETIVIREISEKDARKEIMNLIKKTDGKIYPSEISKELGISYDLTLKIVLELINSDKVEVVEEE